MKIFEIKPFKIILFLALFYAISILLNQYKSVFYGDVGLMYIQVHDIISSGYSTFALNYGGEIFDSEFKFFPYGKPFVAGIGEKHYFVFPPYFLILSAFFYQIFGSIGFYVLNYFAFLSTLFLNYKIGVMVELKNTYINLSILLYTFGMTASNYNFVFHELPFGIFWITLSIYFAIKFLMNSNAWHSLLFGLFGGISLFFRLEMVFIVIACGLSLAIHKREKFFTILRYSLLGFVFPFLVLMILNFQIHNHPFGLRFLLNLSDGSSIGFKEKLRIIYDLLFLKSIGLFYQSPYVLIVFLFPFINKKKYENLNGFLFSLIVISLVCILITSPNNGGHISPRYLFGIFPILSLFSIICFFLILDLFETVKWKTNKSFIFQNSDTILKIAFSLVILASIISTFNNYRWMQKASANVELFNNNLQLQVGQNPIIFRDYSQPLNAQSLYINRLVFVVEKDEELLSFLDKLRLEKPEFLISQVFPMQMDEAMKVKVKETYKKILKLDQVDQNYLFSDSKNQVVFEWKQLGKNQSHLILNIFRN